ncbi:uncharacterized protein EI97DRAFT_8054 [Westerdykella ornata]|uniref:gamma-glutamylcyclotransferase n=1 Tax=Westerdykella ornata TaxID=318751 RepID=A0A6A6JWI4_WESOR|nr:uncharacterized protein EI97DRAFT_8054 [Westerdykella ornata]KAF2280767.1 hypothetical protein EI97DRAFT_8054 [Westerdykella ornata]
MTTERAIDDVAYVRRSSLAPKHSFPPVPQTSQERLNASLDDKPLDHLTFTESELSAAEEKGKTILYLAYGSNLCAETFRGVRGIKPLSQINVVVPELRLTFDLPGVPYAEPCFANSARRDYTQTPPNDSKSRYHKDRWTKGMVGCVYEVTLKDYAHIIATEGGGSAYHDILVSCYPLPHGETVPELPSTKSFKAHTLFAPAAVKGGLIRPDPSYAQPSARYLKLIWDGANELDLPAEYQRYLHDIRPYTVTTKKQTVGKVSFMAIWMPFVIMIFGLQRLFKDKRGRSPKWLAAIYGGIFRVMWQSYDGVFKPIFGDGERTLEDRIDDIAPLRFPTEKKRRWSVVECPDPEEKQRLLV